jgi:hypothetical protein
MRCRFKSFSFKGVLGILNWFLVENIACGRHLWVDPDSFVCTAGNFFGRTSKKVSGNAQAEPCKSPRAQRLVLFGGKMVLFSRAFIRKRAISLATTASVAATSFALAQDPARTYHVRGAMPVQHVADRPDGSDEQSFLSENDAAMNRMMADMKIKPTGDVDRDFVAMMVPHHQGAVDMAKAELKYGHNEQLRRLAQEIVVTQQQEITVMRHAVGDELPPGAAAPTQPGAMPSSASSHDPGSHGSMNMK